MRVRALLFVLGLVTVWSGNSGVMAQSHALSVAPLPPVEARDPRFGIVQAMHAPQLAANAGASWERIIFPWSLIQRDSPNEWNEQYFTDRQIREQAARGVTLVGVLIYTPHWASPNPREAKPVDVPRNLHLPFDHPENYWGQFVRKAVTRHQGVVDHWVVWNEPDLYDLAIRYTYSGSYEEYLQLLRVAYLNVKDVNPKAKVVMGGMAYWWDKEWGRTPYLLGLMEVLKDDRDRERHDNYFDILALHTYGSPLNAYAIPMMAREWLQQRGMRKPIWITESNIVPFDDPVEPLPAGSMRATMDEQASFVIQSYAMGIAAGVERQAIYKMVDEESEQGQYYGLVRNDGTTRPAYTAYQVAASYFSDVKSAYFTWPGLAGPAGPDDVWRLLDSINHRHQFIWPSQVSRVVMERGDRRTTVLWNTSPVEVETSFPAASKQATLVTKYGQTYPIAARDGQYVVTLHGATNNSDLRDTSIYLVGGEPVIIDEPVEPLPERVRARIDRIISLDEKPLYEADRLYLSTTISRHGGDDPVPCRWEPEVQLWGRTEGRRDIKLATASRRIVTEQGRTYTGWEFHNANVSKAMDPEGKRLVSLSIRVEGVPTESDIWPFPPAPVGSSDPDRPVPTPTPGSLAVVSPTVLARSCQ